MITVITADKGRVRAFATGARNIKSSKVSATALFCYSDITLYCGRDTYRINDASPIEVFFPLRGDIFKMSLAEYFCELANLLAPAEEPAEDFLSLLLNAFHLLCRGDRDRRIIKAAVELRMMCLSGFMPNLISCVGCKKEVKSGETLYFLPSEGGIGCGDCYGGGILLTPGTLAAMRHIVYSEPKKIFSYKLSEENLELLNSITEKYIIAQTDRHFKTLDFLRSL